ncbi:right-handed parallel beta-helix repeat-containing protein [Trichothermofontia sichuanensis B231]|uniref:right-handed parallel beta-helix repeat-containing protein n=1 Tax=Trichothermofontia sichuanensis TaxID=3045816 RepID=UPI0022480D8B|nr:right-handed parallel beta-helix repeat-containing protein [Trichothermofontia sichuanensis]UZQ53110.1 right-handed parallel beta-helix repeat-containing protein [Trichothermofontia sichuanensis B231]
MMQWSKRCLSTGVVVLATLFPFSNTDANELDLSLASDSNSDLTQAAIPRIKDLIEDLPVTPTTVPENFVPLFTPRVGVRSSTAEAGGNPFSVIEGFVPLAQSRGRDLLFMEGRQFYDLAEGTAGRNFLLGYRTYDAKNDRVWGGYVAYDNRDTGNSLFDQIGVGLESVGQNWELRLNGYLPIGNTRDQVLEVYASGGQFQGNSLLVERARVFESALGGFDAEVGTPLARWDTGQLKGYAGVYYLGGSGSSDTVGLRGRLQAQINDLTAVGLTLEQDDLFDTRAIVNVGLTFRQTPKGRGDRPLEISPVIASLGSRVQRSSSIAINSDISQDVTIARNPDTGQPLTFRHVDLGNGTGAGTVESPFGSMEAALAAANPGDIVRVGAATDTTLGELRIPDRVNLVAASMPTAVRTRQAARVALPRAANTGRITVNGPVILESNGTVSGLIINAHNNHGVIGNNVSGVASVVDNTINVTGEFDGINITNTGGSVDLTIARNEINGGRNGIFINTQEGAEATVTVADNRIQDTRGSGIFFRIEGDSRVNATIARNTVLRNQGLVPQDGGLRFGIFNTAIGNAIVQDNTFNNNRSHGMFVGSQANGQLTATFTNNTANNNLGNGLFFGAEQNSMASATIVGNTTNNNQLNPALGAFPTGHGLAVGSQNDGQTRATIANNTANNNASNGIFVFAQPGATAPDAPPPRPLTTADILNNTVYDSGLGGIILNNATGRMTIADNRVQNIGGPEGNGIAIFGFGGLIDLDIRNNTVEDTTGVGIGIFSRNQVQTIARVDNNTTRNSVGSGIRFFTFDDAQVTPIVTNNDLRGNQALVGQDGAIRIGTFNRGQVTPTVVGNTIRDNTSNGIFMGGEDEARVNAVIRENRVINNTGNGIFFGSQNQSEQRGLIIDNFVTGQKINTAVPNFPTGHGIFFGAQGNGRAFGTITDNEITNNESNGIFTFVSNTGFGEASILNNEIRNNARSGIEVNIGLNPVPINFPEGSEPPPLPEPGTFQGNFTIADNDISGNPGAGPPGQGGAGIVLLTFNNALVQAIVENNRVVNYNGVAPNAVAGGLGLLAFDDSQINARVRFNELMENSAKPQFNAVSLNRSQFCLALENNRSDTTYALSQVEDSQFQAQISGNRGPRIVRMGNVRSLGTCRIP